MGKIKDLLRKWLYPVVGPEIKPVEVITQYQKLQRYECESRYGKEWIEETPKELINKILVRRISEQMEQCILRNLKTEYDPETRSYKYWIDYWMRE